MPFTDEEKQQKLEEYLSSRGIKYAPKWVRKFHKDYVKKLEIAERKAAKKADYIDRVEKMVAMKREGNLTLEQVGVAYGVTRERVRQLIAYHPGYTLYKSPGPKMYDYECKWCHKKDKSVVKIRIFCNEECLTANTKATKLTREEKLRRMNERNKKYYHDVQRHDPVFKLKARKWHQDYMANLKKDIKRRRALKHKHE